MKEQQPLGISELQQKLGKIDQALGKANRVIQAIGTPEFGRPELNISPSSQLDGNVYLDAAIRVGRVRKALTENAIPKLNDSKGQIQNQIDDLKTQEQKAQKLEEAKELVQLGYLPDYALKRSQEILQATRTQQDSMMSKVKDLMESGVRDKVDIARRLGAEAKQIDNAIHRLRRKGVDVPIPKRKRRSTYGLKSLLKQQLDHEIDDRQAQEILGSNSHYED